MGNSFQWSDSLTKVKGNHTMKFGADLRRMRFDQTLYFEVNGYYNYFGGGTNDVGFSNDLYPNYLLGLPDTYQQGAAQSENVRTTAVYLFAQDSWKIRPNVTLNYGLRWELNHSADRHRASRADLPSGAGHQHLSLPAFRSYGAGSSGDEPDCNTVFPTGLVVPGDKGVPQRPDSDLLQDICSAHWHCMESGHFGQDQHPRWLGNVLQPDGAAGARAVQRRASVRRQHIPAKTFFNTPFYAQDGFAESQSV